MRQPCAQNPSAIGWTVVRDRGKPSVGAWSPVLVCLAVGLGGMDCAGSCSEESYCRSLDLATWCSDNDACEMPAAASVSPGDSDDQWAEGTFEGLPPGGKITIPLEKLGHERILKPHLVVSLYVPGGDPSTSATLTVTVDESVLICGQNDVDQADGGTRFRRACDLPPDARELSIAYGSDGSGASDLGLASVLLFMQEAVTCTGTLDCAG